MRMQCIAGHSVLPLSCLLNIQTLDLPDRREMLRQKYTRSLIVDRTRKIHSDISSTHSLHFIGSKDATFGLDF